MTGWSLELSKRETVKLKDRRGMKLSRGAQGDSSSLKREKNGVKCSQRKKKLTLNYWGDAKVTCLHAFVNKLH